MYPEKTKTGKDKYHMISLMWNLKNYTSQTYLQNRNRLTNKENKLMAMKGKNGGRIN